MMMNISLSVFKEAPLPQVNLPSGDHINFNMDRFIFRRQSDKNKVVVVIGATGTGKSRLSIDLATRFDGEIINSDCMQVYKGLDIVTNKVTDEERRNVPHHLLGFMDPEHEFTAVDFAHHASLAVKNITQKGKLPIIAGGSNSYVNALAIDTFEFQAMYDCCFLWVDVSMPVLHSVVSERVDRMVEAGLVEEGKDFFDPRGDYTRGIKRSIGVPEMHDYYKNEAIVDDYTRDKLLERAIDEIKANTRELTCRQVQKILKLKDLLMWRVHHLNATDVFLKRGYDADEAWKRLVSGPSAKIVEWFLHEERVELISARELMLDDFPDRKYYMFSSESMKGM